MKKMVLIVMALSLSTSISLFGQTLVNKPRYVALEPIFSWANDNEISANVGVVEHLYLDEYPVASWGPFVGAGARLSQDSRSLISKMGYSWYYTFYGARFQFLNYTNFSISQFALRPEVGFSYASWVNLLYGYTLNLEAEDQFLIQGHTLSISINLSSYLVQ
jgi:hypothetical protein